MSICKSFIIIIFLKGKCSFYIDDIFMSLIKTVFNVCAYVTYHFTEWYLPKFYKSPEKHILKI